ncbi:hypothetical protein DM02DRAFT_654689 [Periconia macrospinosa]|uniref:Uncharacterized protein n=1 Tax=Periconia macrospinosa TaxID=97972 RepID=A0A2V1DV71_9PLEO|nr:hypothetical protein DM02DRAFT_654689 [Periconia macrospinosa]
MDRPLRTRLPKPWAHLEKTPWQRSNPRAGDPSKQETAVPTHQQSPRPPQRSIRNKHKTQASISTRESALDKACKHPIQSHITRRRSGDVVEMENTTQQPAELAAYSFQYRVRDPTLYQSESLSVRRVGFFISSSYWTVITPQCGPEKNEKKGG